MAQFFTVRSTAALLIEGTAYVLKPSLSSYGIWNPKGERLSFCCQDGCCDRGLQPDVLEVVERAKAEGATKVVLRVGQRVYCRAHIAGLPVECVSDNVGSVGQDFTIRRGWG